jgi:hypothetical protein
MGREEIRFQKQAVKGRTVFLLCLFYIAVVAVSLNREEVGLSTVVK